MYMIVGAAGFLGSYIIDELLKRTNEEIVAVDLNVPESKYNIITWERCDITNFDEIDKLNEKYRSYSKKIVFCSACHNPDYVESHFNEAWKVNIVSLAYFVNKMENIFSFIYPSTDSVYGNTYGKRKAKENSKLNPVNAYGRQKVLAEKIVVCCGYNVIRLPFMIGKSLAQGRKHFFDVIVDTIKSGKSFEMFADSYRSTLSFRQVAIYILKLLLVGPEMPKIINICSDDGLSKYDVGVMIAKHLNLASDLIQPIYMRDNFEIFKAQRAFSTLMDNTIAKKVLCEHKILFDVDLCF